MKETGEITATANLNGDKLYQQRARQALPLLVRQASAEQPITYGNLAEELGIPNPRNLNFVLGAIGNALLKLSQVWEDDIPAIQAMVINKNSQLPGDGIAWFAVDARDFRTMSTKQKREIINAMLSDVYKYRKWNDVLQYFGLQPTKDLLILPDHIIFDGDHGESIEHRSLKEYIAHNPQAVGLPQSYAPGITEFIFGSADAIDVLFQTNEQWVGVEVKSSRSSTEDISRGLFQCVKYQALIEATLMVKQLPVNCHVLLAVEDKFPQRLIALRNVLNVPVYRIIREEA